MEQWNNFFLAQTGASAALTGLLFVSVSISLAKILETTQLPNRAFQAITILLQILVISSLGLVPGQTLRSFGIEALAIGLIVWALMLAADINSFRATEKQYRHLSLFNAVLSQVACLPYVAASVLITLLDPAGFYWLVAGMLLSYGKAIFEAWVLLVEINR